MYDPRKVDGRVRPITSHSQLRFYAVRSFILRALWLMPRVCLSPLGYGNWAFSSLNASNNLPCWGDLHEIYATHCVIVEA